MVAAVLIVVLALTALLLAAGLRLDGVAATLVAAYVIAVGELVALTTVLSPFRAVTREGLAVAELVLGLTVVAAWWHLGRPRPPLRRAAVALRQVLRDPAALVLLLVCAAVVGYELLLVLSVPPNNWDSLTYHLARAAAWAQHGGVYWIDNAPTDRINEFQPLAEQEILFLFVAAGSGALFALPQFVAQLAIVLAVYTSARRLGYGVEAAAGSSLLFSTFTIVALEATTAQNDLVAASLPAAAAALVLGTRRSETALAGLAAGLMLGVKLTTIFVLPVLVTLAALRGRRPLLQFAGATVGTFVALGAWGFVRNVAETGEVLGRGGGRIEHTAETSLLGTLATGFRVGFRLFDLSGFDDWMVWAMAIAGLGVALGITAAGWGQGSRRATAMTAAAAALPLLAPALVLGLAAVSHGVAKGVRLPVNEEGNTSAHFSWQVNRDVNEDVSGFGPLGLLLLAASFATIVASPASRRPAAPRPGAGRASHDHRHRAHREVQPVAVTVSARACRPDRAPARSVLPATGRRSCDRGGRRLQRRSDACPEHPQTGRRRPSNALDDVASRRGRPSLAGWARRRATDTEPTGAVVRVPGGAPDPG